MTDAFFENGFPMLTRRKSAIIRRRSESIVDFVLTKKVQDMIERGKERSFMICRFRGHDYREVEGIEGEICVCCGKKKETENGFNNKG